MCGKLLYEVATLQISFSKRNETSFFVNLTCLLLPPIESPILVQSLKIKIFRTSQNRKTFDYNLLSYDELDMAFLHFDTTPS